MTRHLYILVVDANVLIDYAKSSPEILGLAAFHLAELVVLSPLMDDEVDDLDADTAIELGLKLFDPTVEQLAQAGTLAATAGGLSFYDWLCLLIARDAGDHWVVLSNDGKLLAACKEHGVRTMRGLRLMLDLVQDGHLSSAEALRIASDICGINAMLGTKVLNQFRKELRRIPASD